MSRSRTAANVAQLLAIFLLAWAVTIGIILLIVWALP